MSVDLAPILISVIFFVILSPGLLFQLPGSKKGIEFVNMRTSGLSIFVHTIIFTAILCILLIAIGVHIYVG
ncbi:uncharacterized protein LOC131016041 [Salvia miltiorrhiza]|uniref:uncharacterized protein LOC131016041 n=1 Tax=Salvia miltiorrhiza TaxID=226208 RepID=UPI0025AB8B66|nr:uncharacterized protein LOC131016041 [Salvia miltiorrhiza]